MASSLNMSPTAICSTCSAVEWFQLPAEDSGAVTHHKSRKELEKSAKTCRLCAMILRAAVTNLEADNIGRWREFTKITTDDGTKRSDVICIRDLGRYLPAHFHHRPIVIQGSGHGTKFIRDFTSETDNGLSVLAFTSDKSNTDGREKDGDLSASVERLDIEGDKGKGNGQSDDLPVWVYGNYWVEYDPRYPDDASRSTPLLVGIGARFGKSGAVTDVANGKPGLINLRGSTISIRLDDDSPASQLLPGRIPETNSDSDVARRRLTAWIQHCESNHAQCKVQGGPPKLPTRVIDVQSSDRSVKLVESQGSHGQYVALSHTWGKTPRLVTTAENLTDLKVGIAVSFLPKTFQDAIRITRRLKIKYLWIDCLCIIQDAKDWEREAASMTNVYRNAYITISAAASSDSYSGCFPTRSPGSSYPSLSALSLGIEPVGSPHPRSDNGVTLIKPLGNPPRNVLHVRLSEDWLPGSLTPLPQDVRIGYFGRDVDPLASEPLSTRGWTLQERLLSRRVIHFATDRMYFECETELVSECGFKMPNTTQWSIPHCIAAHQVARPGPPKGVSLIVGRHVTANGEAKHHGWLSLVQDYSKRSLTDPQDKLTAIAGVARLLAQETGDRYMGGIWTRHLMEDLAWRVQTHEEWIECVQLDGPVEIARTGAEIGSASRPTGYRAPSWSWASVDAPVKFIPLSRRNTVCLPRYAWIEPSGDDHFGRLKGGFLDIDAPIFQVHTYEPQEQCNRHGKPAYIDLGDERGKAYGSIFLDLPHEPLPSPCYALFLDPAHAIIIRSVHMEIGTASGSSTADNTSKPKPILSTSSLPPSMRKPKRGSRILWLKGGDHIQISQEEYDKFRSQMLGGVEASLVAESNYVGRIGVGEFVKHHGSINGPGTSGVDTSTGGDNKPSTRLQDYEKEIGRKVELSDLMHISGDESWGVVTKDDAWVPVSIR